jgi:hypothetical protein
MEDHSTHGSGAAAPRSQPGDRVVADHESAIPVQAICEDPRAAAKING